MGKVYDGIDAHWREWIARQALFFVGTAPLAGDGHVNVSPKGPIGSLRVLDEHTVAYLDVIGSGAETIAHLRENGRIVGCSARSRGRRGSCACTAAARWSGRAIRASPS